MPQDGRLDFHTASEPCLIIGHTFKPPLIFWTGAKFEFPDTSGTFKATKNARVTLPFLLNTERCKKDDLEFTISIAKKDNGIFSDFCKLVLLNDGSCVSLLGENCKCEAEKGSYSLTKTIDMSDETVWRWRTSDGTIASDKMMQFVVD